MCAHHIENNELAYVTGTGRWHGLGTEFQRGASLGEIMAAAKMTWSVEMRELAFMLPGVSNDLVNPLTKFRAATRSDNDRVFAVHSNIYNPVQPTEIVDFFSEFCEAGHAEMETVGALKGGAIIWALAKLTEDATKVIMGEDKVEGRLLLATSYDGSIMTIGRATQICVVCWNTLSAALRGESRNQFKMSHITKWTPQIAEDAKKTMGMAIEAIAYTNEVADKLAHVKIDDKGWMEFITRLIGDENVKDEQNVLKPMAGDIWEATRTSPGANLDSRRETLWGAVNGVTYFADHMRGKNDDTRMRSAWFGDSERLKNSALEVAVEMAGV